MSRKFREFTLLYLVGSAVGGLVLNVGLSAYCHVDMGLWLAVGWIACGVGSVFPAYRTDLLRDSYRLPLVFVGAWSPAIAGVFGLMAFDWLFTNRFIPWTERFGQLIVRMVEASGKVGD